MRAAIVLVLAILSWSASAQPAQDQKSNTCEWYLKNRPKLDSKIVAALLGGDPKELEEMNVWLDRYCPEHPTDNLAWAMSKSPRESKAR